jgi:hypothetical protein
MISIQLMGGLGNQLFQMFATIAYAIRHKHKFIFPYSDKLAQRVTYWNNFMTSLKLFTTANMIHKVSNDNIQQMETIVERDFRFTELPPVDSGRTFKLQGYFQSYKYFQDVQDQIYGLFRMEQQKMALKRDNQTLFAGDANTISMHFRLGDYKNLQHYHPIMPAVYYRDALSQIIEKNDLKNARVLYFCEEEDNEYVGSVIQKIQHFFENGNCVLEFVKVDDKIDDWKQMLIMSICQHNIIANSSFSWWGAYLNTNPSKIVCYPSLWFGQDMHNHHGYKDTSDLFPPQWIKVMF